MVQTLMVDINNASIYDYSFLVQQNIQILFKQGEKSAMFNPV